MMDKRSLTKLIDVAAGRVPADLVIANCLLVDVYAARSYPAEIALCGESVAGVAEPGTYQGREMFDARGAAAIPGLIESHTHIESTFLTPEEFGRLVAPRGTTTVIADPHEIVNVCGLEGLRYMMDAAAKAPIDIRFMVPTCVPCAPFEHNGATISAADMAEPLKDERILGLGEFMNFAGVAAAESECVDKLLEAFKAKKIIDGHAPGLGGLSLNAYRAAGVTTDHECSTAQELEERVSRGMYVLLRNGSAAANLRPLLKGVTPANSRRCVLCCDDIQPVTIFERGHIDGLLRVCVQEGVPPETAVQMATLNAAECYGLNDRGAIAPGMRADIALVDNLRDFSVQALWAGGRLVAKGGEYLLKTERADFSSVAKKMRVAPLSVQDFELRALSNEIPVIEIAGGSILTKKGSAKVERDQNGIVQLQPGDGLAKMAVVERHHATGSKALALIKGYGIRRGAVAISVAHDSHNIIAAGIAASDMFRAVSAIEEMGGGAALVLDGAVIECLPLPVAGLMTDKSAEETRGALQAMRDKAFEALGVSRSVDPLMTLCFMALPVVPELKLTDMGLFDVAEGRFVQQ